MIRKEEAGLVDHLEELRKRLIISLLSIAGLTTIGFFASDFLVGIISAPVRENLPTLYFLSPYEAFMVKLKISLASGMVLSTPVIFTQLWLFVSPGLYPKEQRTILPLVLVSTLLFIGGVLFAYLIVIPFALKFLLNFQTSTLVPLISIGDYLSFFLSFILIFGIIFDVPVVLVGLVYMGVLSSSFLSRQRKAVVVLIFVLAAILTPTVDVLTQCLLAFPLWVLFEISIWVGKGIEKRRAAGARGVGLPYWARETK